MTQRLTLSLMALGAAAVSLLAHPVHSQAGQNCAQRDRVVAQLTDKFGESRRSIAMAQNNSVVEVYASDDTGTWTITVTMPNGLTCLLASGKDYETLTEGPLPAGAPT